MDNNQEYQMRKAGELKDMMDHLMDPCTEEEDSLYAAYGVLSQDVLCKRMQQIMLAQNDLLYDMILDLHSH